MRSDGFVDLRSLQESPRNFGRTAVTQLVSTKAAVALQNWVTEARD
jgi:hypothetical protein